MSAPGGPGAPRASGPAQVLRPGGAAAPGRGTVPERVADAVLAHPDVVRLDGGAFGALTTYLPGRTVVGVVLGDTVDPPRVGVVLRLGARVRPTADAVRRIVAAETGSRRVDVVVADVELPDVELPDVELPGVELPGVELPRTRTPAPGAP